MNAFIRVPNQFDCATGSGTPMFTDEVTLDLSATKMIEFVDRIVSI